MPTCTVKLHLTCKYTHVIASCVSPVFNIQELEVAMTAGNCSSYENWTSRWVSYSTRIIDDTIYVLIVVCATEL